MKTKMRPERDSWQTITPTCFKRQWPKAKKHAVFYAPRNYKPGVTHLSRAWRGSCQRRWRWLKPPTAASGRRASWRSAPWREDEAPAVRLPPAATAQRGKNRQHGRKWVHLFFVPGSWCEKATRFIFSAEQCNTEVKGSQNTIQAVKSASSFKWTECLLTAGSLFVCSTLLHSYKALEPTETNPKRYWKHMNTESKPSRAPSARLSDQEGTNQVSKSGLCFGVTPRPPRWVVNLQLIPL